MAIQQDRQAPVRRFRFRRMALKSSLVLGLVTSLTVVAARIPDRFVCLQLVTGYGGGSLNFDLVDLNSGLTMPDTRRQTQPFGIFSPDGKLAASAQPSKSDSSENDLVIQRYADQPEPQATIVVQSGIGDLGSGFNRFRNIRWAPDSSRLAYVWTGTDEQTYLSVVNADGSGRQTAQLPNSGSGSNGGQFSTFGRNGFGDVTTLSWSADNTYLSADESANGSASGYSLWSVADLKRIYPEDSTVLHGGVWAPQSDRFAAISQADTGEQALVIWTPDKALTIPIDTPRKIADRVIWSSSGQYLALQSHQPCEAGAVCTDRWTFDIFGSDGGLLAGDLHGAGWDSSTTIQLNGAASVAVWSADGASWVFLRENSTQKDLVALHVAEQRYETIASNVVGELAVDMLNTWAQFRRFGPPGFRPSLPATQRIVLPTWQDGKITVELADIDGKNRTTLVTGADEVVDPGLMTPGGSNHFWPFNADMVVVVWATKDVLGERQVHLTWSQLDGSNKREMGDPAQAVSRLQIVTRDSQRLIGYMALREGVLGIEVAEAGTGTRYRVLDNLSAEDRWAFIPAPTGNLAAVQLGASTGRYYGESTLYLVALDGAWSHEVTNQALGGVRWSPDGLKLAFLHHDASNAATYAGVVTAKGDLLQDVSVQQQTNNNQPRLYRWSQCT